MNGNAVLLVKRDPGKARSFSNHEELRQALEQLAKSKSYYFREFAPPPQPRGKCGIINDMLLFKQSKVIVAPHGAGLSNFVLCNPGTIVVETHTSYVKHLFTAMSMKLGLRHFSLFDDNANHTTQIVANVSAIIGALNQIL